MDRLALYRTRHVIDAEPDVAFGATRTICETCGIRVHPRHGPKLRSGWYHDPDEIRRLVKEGGRG